MNSQRPHLGQGAAKGAGTVSDARSYFGGSHALEDDPPEAGSKTRVLVVDDEHTIREGCATILEQEGFSLTLCGHGEEAAQAMRRSRFDVALLDLYMRGVPGLELLRTCLEQSPDTLVIMMTGNPSVESSVEALRMGAWDYLVKPFTATQLQILLGRATHALSVARESASLAEEAPEGPGGELPLVLGESAAFREMMEQATRVAPTDASVFITGESGTGKELIAQFIHRHSRRRSRAMVPVNCAALPENLLESEIFGHTKGAFTGASSERVGLMETAHGGTLFLDELTEMSQSVQAKLLRVIQDGVVRRVGSSTAETMVNVRFISATNRDLRGALEKGEFRRDLYYRLRVVPIHVPPLRERRTDIPLLAQHFLGHYWRCHRGVEAPPVLTQDAIRELQSRRWHGNVRELANVMEHLVVLVDPGAEIAPGLLPFVDEEASDVGLKPSFHAAARYSDEDFHTARERWVSEFERHYLSFLLRQTDGNMSEAARFAGIDRKTLFRLRRKHGLDIEPLTDEDTEVQ